MGNCSSTCLGKGAREIYDEDEEARLIFDDPNLGYGSFGEHQMNSQDEAIQAQREIEALQRVVSKTSENMVDVFEIAPQRDAGAQRGVQQSFAYAGQEARLLRYQNLLAKLAANGDGVETAEVHADWPAADGEDTIEMRKNNATTSIRTKADKPLVGTFADAAAAMG